MSRKSKREAYNELISAGVDFKNNFHQLDWNKVNLLLELSRACGYRKPNSASGSTARYFFQHLEKIFREKKKK